MKKISIDKIIRSKRRTLGLEISKDASLVVRAPKKMTLGHIERIVFERRFWIQDKQRIIRERYKKKIKKEFIEGESFLYLGNMYPLSIVDKNIARLSFDGNFRLIRSHKLYAKQVFVDWYKEEAYVVIKERLDLYSNLCGIRYNKFNITNANKRWGSCNRDGGLRFSWKLIMAPIHVIDYVVVHELAHLVERNHSKRFWDKVKEIFPKYKYSKKWLWNNEYVLAI